MISPLRILSTGPSQSRVVVCRTRGPHRGLLLPMLLWPLVLLVGALAAVPHAWAERWTDVSGKSTIEAKFIGVLGEKAILERSDGNRIAVELRNLQYESRAKALEMEEARKEHLASLTEELKRAVEKELEAGPKEIPPSEMEVAEYQPLPKEASLEETAKHFVEQLQEGHVRVVWDALPASYQTDVQKVVVEFARQMDPQAWQDTLRTVRRISELMASRERWVFAYPAFQAAGSDAAVREVYRAALGAVQTLLDPQVMSLQRLQQGKLDELIAERDARLAGYLKTLESFDDGPGLDPSQIVVEMLDENRGTVTIQPPPVEAAPPATAGSPGRPQPGRPGAGANRPTAAPQRVEPITFVRVEGRWVPEDLAKDWDADIAQLQEKIKTELPTQVSRMRTALAAFHQAVDTYLVPLEKAGSEAEFHGGIDQLAAQTVGFAMQAFTAWNGGNRPGGNRFGSAMGMSGYGGSSYGYGEPGYGGSSEMEAGSYGEGSGSYGEADPY